MGSKIDSLAGPDQPFASVMGNLVAPILSLTITRCTDGVAMVGATDNKTCVFFTILRSVRERGQRTKAMDKGEKYEEGKRERFPNYRGRFDAGAHY